MSAPRRLDWNHHQVLAAAVRAGTIEGAARATGLSAPTVRRRLDALERTHGVKLFERTIRGLRPTAAAMRLVAAAGRMEASVARAARWRARAAGAVALAAAEPVGGRLLAGALARLRAEQPDLVLSVTTARRTDTVLELPADLHIVTDPPASATAGGLRLGHLELGLYAHSSYLGTVGTPAAAEDLAAFRLAAPASPEARSAAIDMLLATAADPDALWFASDSMIVNLAVVAEGAAIGPLYCALADQVPDLVRVLPGLSATEAVWMLRRGAGEPTPAAHLVWEVVADSLTPMMADAAA